VKVGTAEIGFIVDESHEEPGGLVVFDRIRPLYVSVGLEEEGVDDQREGHMAGRNREAIELLELRGRYLTALHGMQSGVAFLLEGRHPERIECEAKHLRVGVNSAMSEHSGLAKLLIEKGVFSELEYTRAVTEAAEAECRLYEERVSEAAGRPVKLA